jgi:hypothetical protein
MAPIVAATPRGVSAELSERGHEVLAQFRVRTLHTNNQVNPAVRWLRKGSSIFVLFFL